MYLKSFDLAREGERKSRRDRSPMEPPPLDLPEINMEHLLTLTDSTGLLQHASYGVPRYAEGYCLDDNARALLLMALLEDASIWEPKAVRALARRYLAFVSYAFDSSARRFRNFMSYGRTWLEEFGSEDSHGHAVWALGATVGRAASPGRSGLARELFHAALPELVAFESPRAWAYGLLGIDEYLRVFEGESSVEAVRIALVERLLDIYRRSSSPEWPWFESSVTYSNARLSQALIVSGSAMATDEATSVGLRSLAWLAEIQTTRHDYFAPIGSNGFFERGGVKAEFDQQPVEATAMIAASLVALRVTRKPIWAEHACRAFDWFLGHNHLQLPLYDATSGGCRDGLHVDRLNENQGAESTLSFLLALVDMRSSDYARLPHKKEKTP